MKRRAAERGSCREEELLEGRAVVKTRADTTIARARTTRSRGARQYQSAIYWLVHARHYYSAANTKPSNRLLPSSFPKGRGATLQPGSTATPALDRAVCRERLKQDST
ncbi:hypothetical protein GGTG_13881 [Gaeumannomyces tritici R3-111a-1]|uniref:Uncharacterized protein n=1 Tax=Gaeumannomyces tritici (strain R3-111a-1) TaxID=644352 RepID=J3PK34_GAET3|nr:hypothetical protein GGTG_13881 [Gaeumannomyces tritici R3-111a-1]EJT68550.1 hypothetical protein GGTG_13881 [Gaeumannomyces tritici R3-111a-1]